MKISIALKTLIIVVALMLVSLVSFSSGYFKSQADNSKYSDKYTVRVERTAEPQESISEPPEEETLMVNINTATAEELDKLNGIGPVLAQRIIQHREANGAFEYTYDIMDVSGIGSGIYSKIKDNICVS